jgi:hypothetical protein
MIHSDHSDRVRTEPVAAPPLNGLLTYKNGHVSLILMAPITPTLASVFRHRSDSASWSKLDDCDPLSQLLSKFWGKNTEEEAKQWRMSHSPVKDDPINDIGPNCYGLDLDIELRGSKLWIRQDYIRIYDYCSKRYEEGSTSVTEMARSVVITGQPGTGVLLSSVVSCAFSNNLLREKVKHIGSTMLFVVVSANRSHFFGIKVATASYLSRMESFNKTSRVSLLVTLRRSYGRSLIRMNSQPVFPEDSVIFTQTSILCSPPLRNVSDGKLWRIVRIVRRSL